MKLNARWIGLSQPMGDVCPQFETRFILTKDVQSAMLRVTAMGVYEARINGRRVGDFILAPGFTSYETRVQVQTYDVTSLLSAENCLSVRVGGGWCRNFLDLSHGQYPGEEVALIAELTIINADGTEKTISTDDTWQVRESAIRKSEIYDGEEYDARVADTPLMPVRVLEKTQECLIPQEGEEVIEHERVGAVRQFVTPKGERVIDFGQEVTGYVEITVDAKAGDRIELSHAEVLDKEGNFYTENYRAAKAKLVYVCRDGMQTYKPVLTFYGFRYIRLDSFPGEAQLSQFTAISVHSRLRRTGFIRCGEEKVNRLMRNVIWGQKDNFLDVPTDCPQRNERLGWTGDAEVFCKTASYNFDVERFFTKWLRDMAADQKEDGRIPHVIPEVKGIGAGSAAWDDAAVICPWQIYMTYGNPAILRQQFDCMKKYVDFITHTTKDPYLWTGGKHYGDWLGLDAPSGSYKGSSREELIASAYYAYSTQLLCRAGRVLGEDMREYEALYEGIVKAFRARYTEYKTQTEMVLAVHFRLAEDLQATADRLAQRIRDDGMKMQTGFVGTPYILHALSDYGHADIAYSLLLRREYPSWLYAVEKGATTIWEHWDGIMEDGSFWSADMNSFNHYAYGSVADWVYEAAAGITPLEPGFARVRVAPQPDRRLGWLDVSIDTRQGTVRSCWRYEEDKIRFEIDTPVETQVVIAGKEQTVPAGSYVLFAPLGD